MFITNCAVAVIFNSGEVTVNLLKVVVEATKVIFPVASSASCGRQICLCEAWVVTKLTVFIFECGEGGNDLASQLSAT